MKEHGLVLGKFYPFHKGHEFLIKTASQQVKHLTILVCSLKSETIPGRIRFEWVKKTFPNCRVIHVTDENPQVPEEHPDFWNIWQTTIKKNHPEKIDLLFTSEDYGNKLSDKIGCEHYCVDKERNNYKVTGTMVRENPYKEWDFLTDISKPYFIKKIVITGPESCGKTTICKRLANFFHTEWIPENGRVYLEEKKSALGPSDILPIGMGHVSKEDEVFPKANKFLICDTDLIITKLYSQLYFGFCPDWITNEIEKRKYDLYFVLTPEVKWIPDKLRDFPDQREEFMENILSELKSTNANYKIISGDDHEKRFSDIVKEIINYFPKESFLL